MGKRESKNLENQEERHENLEATRNQNQPQAVNDELVNHQNQANTVNDVLNGNGVGVGQQAAGEETQLEENAQQYIAQKPDDTSPLKNFERSNPERVAQNPVFETHSRGKDFMTQHSFMGLRYTKFNLDRHRLERKRIAVGFGATSGPFSAGRMMDDGDSDAEISSETPISMTQFENVVGAIEHTQTNTEDMARQGFFKRLFKSGKRRGTEFSGKYNLLTNNCNNFVIAMAKAAGVNQAAMLHKTILGPMEAYIQLAEAAEDEEQVGGTRIFQGSNIWGKREEILGNFPAVVRDAAKEDGIDLEKYPELSQKLDEIANLASRMNVSLRPAAQRFEHVENGYGNVEGFSDADITLVMERVRQAIRVRTGNKHPRLNIALLKVEAFARKMRQDSTEDPLTKYEADSFMDAQTGAEKRARGTQPQDTTLFNSANMSDTGSLAGKGEVLLLTAGMGNMIRKINDHRGETEKQQADNLENVVDGLRGDGKAGIRVYVERFLGRRDYLSADQAAKMLAYGILQAMGLTMLATRKTLIWSIDPNVQDLAARIERHKLSYTTMQGKDQRIVLGDKVRQFADADRLVEVLRGLVDEIRQPQGRQ